MSWDRSTGTDPKYRSPEYRRARKRLVTELRRYGQLECTSDDCLMPTRAITNPNGREPDGLHLGHLDDGVSLRGPEHNRCNVSDGARRGRARQDGAEPMRLTPGLKRPPGPPLPPQSRSTRQSAELSPRDEKNPLASVVAHHAHTLALRDLHDRGELTPCADDSRFTSDQHAERVDAVPLRVGCPVFSPCRAGGALEEDGVWGGIDRTRRPKRKTRPKEAA